MRNGFGFVALMIALTAGGAAFAGDLSRLSMEWAADWSGKKLDSIMQLYAPDPVFLPTSGERWEGVAAIRKNFAAGLAQFNPDLRMTSMLSDADEHLAYDSGIYEETVTPVNGGKAMAVKGNYLFVFQHQRHGGWKILEQTFTEYDPAKL